MEIPFPRKLTHRVVYLRTRNGPDPAPAGHSIIVVLQGTRSVASGLVCCSMHDSAGIGGFLYCRGRTREQMKFASPKIPPVSVVSLPSASTLNSRLRQDPILFPLTLGHGRVAPGGIPPTHDAPQTKARLDMREPSPLKYHRSDFLFFEDAIDLLGNRRLCSVGKMHAAGRPIAVELGKTHTSSIQGHFG